MTPNLAISSSKFLSNPKKTRWCFALHFACPFHFSFRSCYIFTFTIKKTSIVYDKCVGCVVYILDTRFDRCGKRTWKQVYRHTQQKKKKKERQLLHYVIIIIVIIINKRIANMFSSLFCFLCSSNVCFIRLNSCNCLFGWFTLQSCVQYHIKSIGSNVL